MPTDQHAELAAARKRVDIIDKWLKEGPNRISMLAEAKKELIDTKGNWTKETEVKVRQLFMDMLLENEQFPGGIRLGMHTVQGEIAKLRGKEPELYELGFTLNDLMQAVEQMKEDGGESAKASSLGSTSARSLGTSGTGTKEKESIYAPIGGSGKESE